jgi:hypothetical protein
MRRFLVKKTVPYLNIIVIIDEWPTGGQMENSSEQFSGKNIAGTSQNLSLLKLRSPKWTTQ